MNIGFTNAFQEQRLEANKLHGRAQERSKLPRPSLSVSKRATLPSIVDESLLGFHQSWPHQPLQASRG
jgi:hypothetical protein